MAIMRFTDPRHRLANLRKVAAKEGGTWRDHRGTYRDIYGRTSGAYNPPSTIRGENHCRWVENTTAAGLRFVGHADEIIRLRHTGWYANNFHDSSEVYRGAVYQLPTRHGRKRFAYGYTDPHNDGAAFLSFDPCDDKEDAARRADSMAERLAEEEREYLAKESAKLRIEEIGEELKTLRAFLLTLCKEARAVCPSLADAPAVKEAIRDRIRQAMRDRTELFDERKKLEENPWNAVP